MTDAFSPDAGQVLNPDGSATYDFQGHIAAQGIDMLSGATPAPPADRRVRWHKDTLTGAVVAELFAYSQEADPPSGTPASSTATSRVVAPAGGIAYWQAVAADQALSSRAELRLTTSNADQGTVTASVRDSLSNLTEATVLSDTGKSSFMQLDGLARKSIAGVGTATFSGTQAYAISGNIAHGLGATPRVMVSLQEWFDVGLLGVIATPYAVGATKFNVLVYYPGGNPPAGTNANFNYMAWA